MVKLGLAMLVAAVGAATLVGARQQPASPSEPQEGVEAAIRAVHAQMQQAAERLDAPALYAHVVDGATPPIIESGRLAETRAAALARTTRGFEALTSVRYAYTKQSITVLSPTVALWIGIGTSTIVLTDGRTVEAPFAESVVYVLQDGEWKVLHAHRSSERRP